MLPPCLISRNRGPNPLAWNVLMFWLGQGRRPFGRRHRQVLGSSHLGCQRTKEQLARYRYHNSAKDYCRLFTFSLQITFAGIRDPLNVLLWAKTGPTLAIGSYRGNLMLYNHKTSRRVPVIGKHSKVRSYFIPLVSIPFW